MQVDEQCQAKEKNDEGNEEVAIAKNGAGLLQNLHYAKGLQIAVGATIKTRHRGCQPGTNEVGSSAWLWPRA